MRLFWTLEAAKKALKYEENVIINAKNRHVKMLENTIASYESIIDQQNEQIKLKKKGNTEDRLIDMAEAFFLNQSKPQAKTIDIQKPISAYDGETGKIYSDDEIKNNLKRIPSSLLKKLVEKGEDEFYAIVKDKVSDISDESANRSYVLAKEMII